MPIAALPAWTGGGGFFTLVGKVFKSANAYRADTTSYATRQTDITNAYKASAKPSVGDSVMAATDAARARLDLATADLRLVFVRTLMDYTFTLQYLGVDPGTPFDVASVATWPPGMLEDAFLRFLRVFKDDSQTVKRCVVTLGSITAEANNVGNGTIVLSKILDGVTRPGDYCPASTTYSGINSELALTETHVWRCVADAQANPGAVPQSGGESFAWNGRALAMGLTAFTEGSGTRRAPVWTIQKDTVVANGDFERFINTTNLPDGWAVTASGGTLGTHIKKTTANAYRGVSGMEFVGDGAQAIIGIQQSFNVKLLQPRRAYIVSVRYKASSAAPAAGDLTVICTGTGYTAGGTESVAVGHAALTTSWVLGTAVIVTPSDIPSDFALVVKMTGTLTNTVSVYVDDVFFAPLDYHGGVGAKAIPGSTPFKVGDLFSADISNDGAGVLSTIWRRWTFTQLASTTSGSETVADSVAT